MRITSVPTSYNLIYLFHCVPAGGGAFRFEYGSAVSAAEIDQVQSRGQRVVLTCGGANAGYNFQNRTESQAFVNSFVSMNNSLGGVDGCDFNNFEARIGSNPTEMVWISQQLKAKYGADFSITCPPAPGAGFAPQDRVLCKALADAGVLSYAGPQFYDSGDLTTEAILMQLIPEWVNLVGGAEKVVIGAGSNYGGGASTSTTASAWKKLVAQYPKLRGVFGWSAQDDAGGSWSFGKTMAPIVGASPVTGGGTTPPVDPPVEPPKPPTPTGDTYVVVAGDTLNKIAAATGVSVANLVLWNKIVNPESIEIGDRLVLKAPTTTPPVSVLKAGDRVKVNHSTSTYHNQTGDVKSVSGNTASVRLDNGRDFLVSWLVKL